VQPILSCPFDLRADGSYCPVCVRAAQSFENALYGCAIPTCCHSPSSAGRQNNSRHPSLEERRNLEDALFSLAYTSTGTLVLLFHNCGKVYVTVQVILVLCGQNTICSKYLVNASMLFPVRCITTSCPCNSTKTCYSNNNSTIV